MKYQMIYFKISYFKKKKKTEIIRNIVHKRLIDDNPKNENSLNRIKIIIKEDEKQSSGKAFAERN